MDWIQVTITTTREGIEPVCGNLYQLGITGLEIENPDDFTDFLENSRQSWDYIDDELMKRADSQPCVKVYISNNPSGNDMLSSIKETLARLKNEDSESIYGRLELVFNNMNEEDWANNWKQYFKPLEIGNKILIRPEWEQLNKDTDRTVFVVNPGMTFGTGLHHTTQLCIEKLEDYVKDGCKLLDLGCGSGILSVISLLLGAESAAAVDIDPNAVEIAYANAERNNVSKDRYFVTSGNIIADREVRDRLGYNQYDVVVANIVADVIIALAEYAPLFMKEDGVFIASGIIDERVSEVKEALLKNGLSVMDEKQKGGWAVLVCRRV